MQRILQTYVNARPGDIFTYGISVEPYYVKCLPSAHVHTITEKPLYTNLYSTH